MRHAVAAILILSAPAVLAAQIDCTADALPKESNEARLLAHFAVPLAYSAVQAPDLRAQRSIQFAIEGSYLPEVDRDEATPTYCRPGKGPENTDLLFGFVRPRLGLALGEGIVFEASWLPPIRINGVKANLFGFSLGRTVPAGGVMLLNGRVHATFGTIRAPITCDENAIRDPTSECSTFGTISDDKYRPTTLGADMSIGWALGGGRFRPYVGGGYNLLRPRFEAFHTGQKVETNLGRPVLFGGATWSPHPLLNVTGEIYSAPKDAVTGRVKLSYVVARGEKR